MLNELLIKENEETKVEIFNFENYNYYMVLKFLYSILIKKHNNIHENFSIFRILLSQIIPV